MRTVVIGVGNPYRCDDGVGPAVADRMRGYGLPGLEVARSLGEATELIELWHGADLAVVVDAVRAEPAQPGRIHRLTVAAAPAGAASSHGVGLGEAIELARVLDRLPGRLVLYAVEVAEVGHGRGLTPAVADAARRLADRILTEVPACA
jgi:hydrogenase maturation protease